MRIIETKNEKLRFDVLDGLRGISILMVFLNHIDSSFIIHAFPSAIQTYISFFFLSGKLGISFFFILSGFLMAYLYANPVPSIFIERRYARIFPPFITMVLTMSTFRLFPNLSIVIRIAIMFAFAYTIRLIWIYIVEKYHKGRLLITLFLFFQFGIAVWYGFFIMRKPPAWFAFFPLFIREGTIMATNVTLTLPFGDYIPMIDGVYWSLIPEVVFYLIYPFIFAPTVQKLKTKSLLFVSVFMVSLFPFFFGVSLLFKHVRNFEMLLIEYFIYFCVGITVAVFVRNKKEIVLLPFLKKLFNPIILFLFLLITHLNLTNTQGTTNLISRLLWSIPFGLIVYGLLDENTSLARFFCKRSFVFLGTISYSMYIGHTALVDGMHLLFKPNSLLTNIIFIISTTIIFLITSYLMHLIIETPYFMFKPKKSMEVGKAINLGIVYLFFFLFFLFTFFTSYTSQFNFFSAEYPFDQQSVSHKPLAEKTLLQGKVLPLIFTAKENSLGIIAFHLEYVSLPKPTSYIQNAQLERVHIKIREAGKKNWYAEQSVGPAEIGKSSLYPFGFPPISDSKGKTYEIELYLTNQNKYDEVYIHSNPHLFSTVHQLDKKTLLTHPFQFAHHFEVKLKSIIHNGEAFIVLSSILPTLLLLFVLSYL